MRNRLRFLHSYLYQARGTLHPRHLRPQQRPRKRSSLRSLNSLTEVAPMTTKFKMHETLENAFVAGLLLTGSVQRAESAILESVRMSCPDDLFGKTLFRRAVHYSIDQQLEAPTEQEEELARAASVLPFELRCVLILPRHLRYCYVLRILVGLSREVCAWLLHLDVAQVDQHTCAAMLRLPLIQRQEGRISEISSAKRVVPNRKTSSSSVRKLRRSAAPYSHQAPVALFTSTKIIQFNKPTEIA